MNFKRIVSKKWFNTEPLTIKDYSGRVIFVNFWTLSCVNSLRSFPRIRELWNKYKDQNLLVVGVHTPQFEFEKNADCVKRTIIANNMYWPIAIDNEYKNWKNFRNKYWPTSYVVDRKGRVVYCHIGEGEYSKIEKVIQEQIRTRNTKSKQPNVFVEKTPNVCYSATKDMFCGYSKGYLANKSGYLRDRDISYKKPRIVPQHKMVLDGQFISFPECVQCQRIGSSMVLNFIATEINATMEPFGEKALAKALIEADAQLGEIKGKDVDESGNIVIDTLKTYNVMRADYPVAGRLSITLKAGKYKAYSFTFSGCSCGCRADLNFK